MTHALATARAALRQATVAVESAALVGRSPVDIAPGEDPELASSLTETLDALITLMSTLGVHPAPSASHAEALEAATGHILEAAKLTDAAAHQAPSN